MIAVENLTIKLTDKVLLSQVNFAVGKGEFWAILGKNGTGKTTLLHTLAGVLDYHTGSIKINAIELNSINYLSRAQHMSLLPQTQEASLDCTVKQAVSYGRYAWHKTQSSDDEKKINQALDDMELKGLSSQSIQQLSGGELRKVEIATILSQDSQLMLLDEPLNHLDLSFRFKLMQKLKLLSQNKAIIMVTHDIQYVAQYCSHVMMLCGDNQVIVGEVKKVLTQTNLTKMLGIKLPETVLKNL